VSLQNVYEKFQTNVDFYWIYISEAHATDDARPSKTVKIKEHTTLEERISVAKQSATDLKLSLPLYVDDMKNTVATAYSAHPDRLFVIGADGKVAYSGGKGPFGFDVAEMTAALEKLVK